MSVGGFPLIALIEFITLRAVPGDSDLGLGQAMEQEAPARSGSGPPMDGDRRDPLGDVPPADGGVELRMKTSASGFSDGYSHLPSDVLDDLQPSAVLASAVAQQQYERIRFVFSYEL